jgi:hypothetical protein
MAIRMKTRFRGKGPKTVESRGNVVAYNIWKIAQESCRRMEKEGFKFRDDRQVTEVMTEIIAFLVQIADRIVYGQIAEDERARFVNALGKELAQHMANNLNEIAGDGKSAVAPSLARGPADAQDAQMLRRSGMTESSLDPIGDHAQRFIATLNARFGEYAECEFSLTGGPGYAFLRTLGDKIADAMAATDSKWVVEQVMDIEAPEAVKQIRKLVHEVMGVKIS